MTRLAKTMMLEYSWPGNIRELKNVMERMVVINFTNVIDGDVVARVLGLPAVRVQAAKERHGTLKAATESLERQMIRNALERYGSKPESCRRSGYRPFHSGKKMSATGNLEVLFPDAGFRAPFGRGSVSRRRFNPYKKLRTPGYSQGALFLK